MGPAVKKNISIILFLMLASFVYASPRLLIVTSESFEPYIHHLIEWKMKMGWPPRLIVVPDGSDRMTVKSAITDSLGVWDFTPECILIVGGDSWVNYSYSYGAGTDTEYGDLDGEIGSEIYTGRLPIEDPEHLPDIVNKIINYERYPFDISDDWMIKGSLVINPDHSAGDSIYWNTLHHVAALMDDAGWSTIDTVSSDYYTGTDLRGMIHEGRGYVIYRGQGVESWWGFSDLNPSSLTNSGMYPVVSGTTCRTIQVYGPSWLNNIAGGAILYLGTLTVGGGRILSQQRSAMAIGFAEGLFDGMYAGEAAELGREYVLDIDDGSSEREYASCVLLGDPTLRMWTRTPELLSVDHPMYYAPGESEITVLVEDAFSEPVESATVAIVLGDELCEYGFTNESGLVTIPYSIESPDPFDTMSVCVNATNHLFYEGFLIGLSPDPLPIVTGIWFNDTILGNADGKLSRTERVKLGIEITNLGRMPTEPYSVSVRSSSPYITLPATSTEIPSLDSLESISLNNAFILDVSIDAEKDHIYPVTITLFDSGYTLTYTRRLPPIAAASPEIVGIEITDGGPGGNDDGIFEWSESIILNSILKNNGTAAIEDISVDLSRSILVYISPDDLTVETVYPYDSLDLPPVSLSLRPESLGFLVVSIPLEIEYTEGLDQRYTTYDTIFFDAYSPSGDIYFDEWLVASDFQAHETYPDDGIFSGGDFIDIDLQVKNLGFETSEDVRVLIRPNLEFFDVVSIDSMRNIGDLFAGHVWSTESPFRIYLEEIPFDALLPIEIWLVNGDFSYYNVITSYLPVQEGSAIEEIPVPLEQTLAVYPNPFNKAVSIVLNEPADIEIMDIKGRIVYQKEDAKSLIWRPQELPSGNYIIRKGDGATVNLLYLK